MRYSDPLDGAYWDVFIRDHRINSQIDSAADEAMAYIHYFLIFSCAFNGIVSEKR